MKRFIQEKIAIKCETMNELNDFLKRCEKAGLKWFSGKKAMDFIPLSMPCYIYNRCYDNRLLRSETCPYEYKSITYKDYFKKEKISITRYDNKVVAKYGNKVGVAKCNPEDEFNFEIGAKLAFDRLFYREDYVKVINNLGYIGKETDITAPFNEKLYVGDVVEIFNIYTNKNCGMCFVCEDEDDFFVMGLKSDKFKNGISILNNWQIRKVKSYKDLKDGDVFGGIKAVLKE